MCTCFLSSQRAQVLRRTDLENEKKWLRGNIFTNVIVMVSIFTVYDKKNSLSSDVIEVSSRNGTVGCEWAG